MLEVWKWGKDGTVCQVYWKAGGLSEGVTLDLDLRRWRDSHSSQDQVANQNRTAWTKYSVFRNCRWADMRWLIWTSTLASKHQNVAAAYTSVPRRVPEFRFRLFVVQGSLVRQILLGSLWHGIALGISYTGDLTCVLPTSLSGPLRFGKLMNIGVLNMRARSLVEDA